MTLLSSVLGFSAFGLGARMFQLGIQKRALWENPIGHVAAITIFGGIGYWAYDVQERQLAQIQHKKKLLSANRAKENAEWAAKATA